MHIDVNDKKNNESDKWDLIPMLVNDQEFSICDDNSDSRFSVIVTLTYDELVYMINSIDEERLATRLEEGIKTVENPC